MTNKSNWTGRTNRTLEEAFGLYTCETIDEKKSYEHLYAYVLITLVICLIVLFWVLV